MKDLEDNIQQLAGWLKTQSTVADWSKVLVGEESDLYKNGKLSINEEKLKTIEQFKPIFESLLKKGYSWLNLNAVGVLNGDLIICVEKPNKSGSIPKEKLSINFSGSAVEVSGE